MLLCAVKLGMSGQGRVGSGCTQLYAPSQGMLATEAGRDWALFKGIEDGVWWPEELLEHNIHAPHHLGKQEVVANLVKGALGVLVPSLGLGKTVAGGGCASEGQS